MVWEPIAKRKTYELIADQLLGEIGTRLQPGDTLPTERELTALVQGSDARRCARGCACSSPRA